MEGWDFMKFEWKKQEKGLYLPKEKPELITVPQQKFLMISGKGNPNDEGFSEKVSVLYSLAYGVKMMPKKGYIPDGYFEYAVYPLEGIWDLTEEGKQSDTLNKDELIYTVMIRQPDFVTQEVVNRAFDNVRKKVNQTLLENVSLNAMEDGLAVQMMHIGYFDDEPKSFEMMKEFINQNNLEIVTLRHREIYLSDARKTEKSRLKTVLRYCVRNK
jgi:hypothetical protein